jgi:N-acetylglucosaminyldiphosphoundecaprenol N-acetyl-beta-D-mannosaminyltransferase
MGRVYGPDLMLAVCARSASAGWRHFLYGGQPGVAGSLRETLERRYPGIRIAGTYCPPFRPLNAGEERQLADAVASAKPDLFWVGLSTPKQERFMAAQLAALDATVMLGVGAAFDIHTGRHRDAPAWVKRAGLQWLHRLLQDPRRLGPRYARIVPAFLFLIALQALGRRPAALDPAD